MVKRILLICLLGISLTALVGNEASARVCVMRSTTGACLVWSGSIECGIGATGIGNVINDPVALGCEATVINQPWVVGCGNPGSKDLMAPGVNLVYFTASLEAAQFLTQGDVDRNGRAYLNIFAIPDSELLQAIEAADPDICPNPNWSVMDAVPCAINSLKDVQLDVDGCITSDAFYSCTLPNCNTLGIDKKTKRFERRQYDCTLIEQHTYKERICPQVP